MRSDKDEEVTVQSIMCTTKNPLMCNHQLMDCDIPFTSTVDQAKSGANVFYVTWKPSRVEVQFTTCCFSLLSDSTFNATTTTTIPIHPSSAEKLVIAALRNVWKAYYLCFLSRFNYVIIFLLVYCVTPIELARTNGKKFSHRVIEV